MQPFHELPARMCWDAELSHGRFELACWDRVAHKLQRASIDQLERCGA